MLDNLEWHVFLVKLDSWIIISPSDKSFGGKNCVFGVCDGLSLSSCSDELLSFLSEGDNGGGGSGTLCIFDDLGSTAFHNSHTRVCGSQIDTDDGSFASS